MLAVNHDCINTTQYASPAKYGCKTTKGRGPVPQQVYTVPLNENNLALTDLYI